MNAGLMLVDIQNDYFAGGRMELVGMDAAAEKAGRLLAYFRENQMPTFYIQHISIREGATFFLPNTSGVKIHASVKPASNDRVIRKNFPNSFRDTTLFDALKSAQVDNVVICGAMSHMCIDATTRAAADLGFHCTLIHDGCATRNLDFGTKKVLAEEVHAAFMASLSAAYADVIACSDYISKKPHHE